jgi:hypothetical protein
VTLDAGSSRRSCSSRSRYHPLIGHTYAGCWVVIRPTMPSCRHRAWRPRCVPGTPVAAERRRVIRREHCPGVRSVRHGGRGSRVQHVDRPRRGRPGGRGAIAVATLITSPLLVLGAAHGLWWRDRAARPEEKSIRRIIQAAIAERAAGYATAMMGGEHEHVRDHSQHHTRAGDHPVLVAQLQPVLPIQC